MMQDDIAHNYMNPHPGKVFNKPNGPDVYKGVPLVRPLGISHNSFFFLITTRRSSGQALRF